MIIVMDGTGAVGSHLLSMLVQHGSSLRAVSHSPAGKATIEGQGVEAVDGDFDQPDQLERVMEGCDHLFLLSPPHPDQAEREKAAIDAAGRAGVSHVVALSVMGADHASRSLFGRWHAEIDDHLIASGLDYTILRPAGFMHVHLLPVHTVRAGGSWYGMTGDGAHGYIDAHDVAAVAAQVITTPGHGQHTYELTGPRAIAMPQAASLLAGVIGRDVAYVEVPADQYRADLVRAGLPDWLAESIVALYQSIREGHLATVTNYVEQLTGRPAQTYRDFVEANKAAFAAS